MDPSLSILMSALVTCLSSYFWLIAFLISFVSTVIQTYPISYVLPT